MPVYEFVVGLVSPVIGAINQFGLSFAGGLWGIVLFLLAFGTGAWLSGHRSGIVKKFVLGIVVYGFFVSLGLA